MGQKAISVQPSALSKSENTIKLDGFCGSITDKRFPNLTPTVHKRF
jgi:hypothetical protein